MIVKALLYLQIERMKVSLLQICQLLRRPKALLSASLLEIKPDLEVPLLPDHLDCYVLLHVQDYRRFESPPETMVVDFARELKFVHEDRFALALRDFVLLVKYLLVYIEIEWVTTHIQVGLKPDPLLEDLSRDYALAGQKLISPELPGLGLVDPPGQLIGCLERCFVGVEIESIANYVSQGVLLDNLPVE